MKAICSYCRGDMGDRPPFDEASVTHGICGPCYDFHLPSLLELDLSRHLDEHPMPVLMVDGDVRVIGLNQAMAAFLGRNRNEGIGLLGGELVGCRHAKLPEGCGRTAHCPKCSFRRTVESSLARGIDIEGREVIISTETSEIRLRVSAYPRDEFVQVVVEEVLAPEPGSG